MVERKNRHIVEKAHALMSEKNMQEYYWAKVVHIAIYIMNKTPTTSIHVVTLGKRFIGVTSDVSYFKVFGCIIYVHIPYELWTKLDPKVEKCDFIGYPLEQKGYHCYNLVTHQIRVSRDVVFDELSS